MVLFAQGGRDATGGRGGLGCPRGLGVGGGCGRPGGPGGHVHPGRPGILEVLRAAVVVVSTGVLFAQGGRDASGSCGGLGRQKPPTLHQLST